MKKDNKDKKGKAIHYAQQGSEIHSNNSFIFSQHYAMESLNPNSISSYGCHGKRLRYAKLCTCTVDTRVREPIVRQKAENLCADSAPSRGPVSVVTAGTGLIHSGRRIVGHEGWSVLVQSVLHPVEHVLVAVLDVVSLLGVRHQIEELIIRSAVRIAVNLYRGLIQLGRREPAVRVAGVTLNQLEATLTEGGVVANLVHVVEELGARPRAAAQQVLPLAHAVDVGDGGISASRLHQGRVPVHHVDQAIVGKAAPLEQAG